MNSNRRAAKRAQKKRESSRRAGQRHQREAAKRALMEQLRREAPKFLPMFRAMISRPNFTTPQTIDENVLGFCESISDQQPFFIACEPEPWSRQSMCNVNVARYVEEHGGRMLCGYRIWYNGRDYIEAERHAIWTNDLSRRDVSFSSEGETEVLFLPDRVEGQSDFHVGAEIYRHAFTEDGKRALRWFERSFNLNKVVKYSDEQGWAAMPSYQEWLEGKRVSNYGLLNDHER